MLTLVNGAFLETAEDSSAGMPVHAELNTQVWRLFTAPFVSRNLMSLAFGCFAFFQLGSQFEVPTHSPKRTQEEDLADMP